MDFKELKLEIFIPESHLPALRSALQSVGAGRLENYDSCLAYSRVTGSWRPLRGSRPYLGTEGEVSETEEIKVEVNIQAGDLRFDGKRPRRAEKSARRLRRLDLQCVLSRY